MSQSSYSAKLRDPRWQKKRLEILNRDGFACRHCGDKTEELQVHHAYYLRGCDPWDYEDGALFTLCRTCHEVAENTRDRLSVCYCQASPNVRAFIRWVETSMFREERGREEIKERIVDLVVTTCTHKDTFFLFESILKFRKDIFNSGMERQSEITNQENALPKS